MIKIFSSKLIVISIILLVDLGGNFNFPGGMIPFMATAAIVGIIVNLLLSIGNQETTEQTEVEAA